MRLFVKLFVLAAVILTASSPVLADDAVKSVNEGKRLLNAGQVREAIQHFDRAIKLNKNLFEAYNERGYAYTRLNELEKAIADFSYAISLKPDAVLYFNRGYAYALLSRYESAVSDFSKAISLDPNDSAPYAHRGVAKKNLGDLAGAISDFDRSVVMNPKRADAYCNRGVVLTLVGKDAESQKSMSSCYSLDSSLRAVFDPKLQEARGQRRKNLSFAVKMPQAVPAKKIEWITDLYTAYQKAVEKKKVLIVYFFGTGCDLCARLESEILYKAEFNAYADRGIFARIDVGRDDAHKNVSTLIRSLKVEKYPALVALDASKAELVERGRIVGHHDPNEYLRQFTKMMP